MSKLHLILDLTTSRVVYFTDNLEESLKTDAHTVLAVFEGELPKEITLKNCYNYRYINKELVLSNDIPKKISLVEQNRTTILKFVKDKVEEKFKSISDQGFNNEYYRCLIDEIMENPQYTLIYQQELGIDTTENALKKIKKDIVDYRTKILKIGTLKNDWLNRIIQTQSNQELFAIRDEVFAKLAEI